MDKTLLWHYTKSFPKLNWMSFSNWTQNHLTSDMRLTCDWKGEEYNQE